METNSNLEDIIQERPMERTLDRWIRSVERTGSDFPFSMAFIAGAEEKQSKAIDYLSGQLGIGEEDRINIDINERRRDLAVELHEIENKVRSLKGKRVLVVARGGFERLFLEQDNPKWSMYGRYGHDWHQNVIEGSNTSRTGEPFRQMGKHLVIITAIGFSYGQEVYENAVKSAVGSQFGMGTLELGE